MTSPSLREIETLADHNSKNTVWQALRLIDEGRSFNEAVEIAGITRSALEKALIEAKNRQELIRRHLQSRGCLTSLLRYPDRGPWGKGSYYGNHPGYLIVDLIDHFKPSSVLDPMEGSGTTGEVCFDFKLEYTGFDLRSGFDLLTSPLPDQRFDLIFWHPPYWPGYKYSDHSSDFSNARGYEDYLKRLQDGSRRLSDLLSPNGHFVILIGDGRKNGVFYPVHTQIISWGFLPLEAILIKEGDHERRALHFRYGPTLFIPTLHEYVLVFKGGGR